MQPRCINLALLASLCISTFLGVSGSTVKVSPGIDQRRRDDDHGVVAPTSTGHSHKHPAPLLELNETEILRWHAPDPLSYWAHDFEASEEESRNWRGLIGVHIVGMGLAFFVLLPVGIALRSVRHRWHGMVVTTFTVVSFLSAAAGSLYKKLTGDLYEGSVHGRSGFLVLGLVSILAACDAFMLLRRAATFLRGSDRRNVGLFWRNVILNQEDSPIVESEYTNVMHEEPEEYVEAKLLSHDDEEPTKIRRPQFAGTIDTSHRYASEWVNREEWPQSAASHRTLVDQPIPSPRYSITSTESDNVSHTPTSFLRVDSHESHESQGRRVWLSRVGCAAHATAERSLVFLAFMQFLTGITVYTGICRQNYINGCMAHLIKGGIFWCYGLFTFGRYLGAWADLGWAWNRLPARRAQNIPTAEMVESFVIFFYGSTNVWMERFGAAPGSPFTTKQIQHISIAVMFWFAGMLGMTLESKIFRRWLSSSAQSVMKRDVAVPRPPSYVGSFNPFPALVIGVTGAAMSAHHQTYLFQVQVHALWGFFLTAFAVLRCLTYFFLWLRPPHSVLPSRPPTEAIASFFLASGGLVFILSTEQITFAAMRRQFDDVMFLFNFAVAVTCLAFCWILSITAFKGWIVSRTRASASDSSAHVLFDEHVA